MRAETTGRSQETDEGKKVEAGAGEGVFAQRKNTGSQKCNKNNWCLVESAESQSNVSCTS